MRKGGREKGIKRGTEKEGREGKGFAPSPLALT